MKKLAPSQRDRHSKTMWNRSEGFFTGYQDIKLFFQKWEKANAQGTVIITHGQGEHSECYSRLINAFAEDSWNFIAWDMRGHGRSEGLRGFASEFDDYCRDFKIFLEKITSDSKIQQGPIVLFCHSMGALVQIKTLLRNPDFKFSAMVVSSPLLGLSVPVPFYKSKGALLLNRILPQVTLGNELTNDMLTSDLDVLREYEQDVLRHTKISSGVFLGFLETFEYVHPRANELTLPTLFILAEQDPVISSSAAKDFYEKLGASQKEVYIYPNAKHELVNDVMRQNVFADIKHFLDRFLEPKK